jgi:sensor histidine kinase regulating citrate/malate metabolism
MIRVTLKQIRNELVLLVDNSCDGNLKTRAGRFLSRKRRGREGLGLASVRAIAAKYGGAAEYRADQENLLFHSEVVMPAKQG